MSEPDQQELERLWGDFLKNANKIGYVVKSNDKINFRPRDAGRHTVSGRISLSAPTSIQLVTMGYMSPVDLSTDQKKKYKDEIKDENAKIRRLSK